MPPARSKLASGMHAQIVGLCLNRGGLCQPLDFLQFWAALWLPIAVRGVTRSEYIVLAGEAAMQA